MTRNEFLLKTGLPLLRLFLFGGLLYFIAYFMRAAFREQGLLRWLLLTGSVFGLGYGLLHAALFFLVKGRDKYMLKPSPRMDRFLRLAGKLLLPLLIGFSLLLLYRYGQKDPVGALVLVALLATMHYIGLKGNKQ